MDLKCVLAVSGGPLAWKDRSLRVDVYHKRAERPLALATGM